MDSNIINNINNANQSNAAARKFAVHKARLDWVRANLVDLWTEDAITIVAQALDGLYQSKVPISEVQLGIRLQKIKDSGDTQSELNLGNLAVATMQVVRTFDALEEMERSGFYRNAKLPEDLLKKHQLFDYIEAAESSISNAAPLLKWLTQLQEPPERSCDPNLYVCLIASSGTGKTQLAATAALKYNEATCIYLSMAQGETQRFYTPHVSDFGAMAFKEAISEFLSVPRSLENAHQIAAWADSSDEGSSLLVRMLYHLLLGTPFLPPDLNPIKLAQLKEKVKGRKYLVFIDEVPPKGSYQFRNALCLRDIFRYLGIAPILMSTHTGAPDYVGHCSRTSVDIWTWVVSRLPRYAPFSESPRGILTETERPFVLALAKRKLKMSYTTSPFKLRDFIQDLQLTLQQKKPAAWGNPALQLAQLFSTEVEIQGESFAPAHELVGHHFGCLLQQAKDGRQNYNYLDAKNFGRHLAVAPVCAINEPLLYLALTTWNEDLLWENNSTQIKFPLVDDQKQPLTVRGAFLKCKDSFTSYASTENRLTAKIDGDLLEVLVHASLTLASLRVSPNEGEFLPGMNLKEFLPFVRKLMLGEQLVDRPELPVFFKGLNFKWPDVPALCGSNSGLPDGFAEKNAINLGCLQRPADSAMVDGIVSVVPLETGHAVPLISVECKNNSGDGVSAAKLKDVFKRIKRGFTCSLVFVSRIENDAFSKTNLTTLKQCFMENHDADTVSVVVWDDGKTPRFLQVNREDFKAKDETTLLVIIISVGVIDASLSRKKRRLSMSCANA